MLQVDVNVSKLRRFAKRLSEPKEGIFPLMNLDLKATATLFLNDLLAAELSLFFSVARSTSEILWRFPHESLATVWSSPEKVDTFLTRLC
jgi:hypothetical protein